MFEEPYRWVEAVSNRRQYLDDQFKQGSPVIALSYGEGIVLLTVSRGTPKLYEIYDRIGFGGMGHPADLEKLRFQLLDMAHLEGFQRSPADVTGARLVKYGLAPIVKQAFEEIFKAPYITKILLAELGLSVEGNRFYSIGYDGGFEESTRFAVLAARAEIQDAMTSYLGHPNSHAHEALPVVLEKALKTWALGSWLQSHHEDLPATDDAQRESAHRVPAIPDEATLMTHLKHTLSDKTVECAVLDRSAPGSSKYSALSREQLTPLLPASLHELLPQ